MQVSDRGRGSSQDKSNRSPADKQVSTLPSSSDAGLASQVYAVAEMCPQPDKVFEAMEFYIDRVEPTVALFNTVLLRHHMSLFVDVITSILSKPLRAVLEVDEDGDRRGRTAPGASSISPPRQRVLIAMGLSLLVLVLHHMPVSEVIARQIVECDTPEEVVLSQASLHDAAMSMLQQSDYLQQPSLWTLQAIVLMRLYWFERMLFSHCTVWNLTAIRLGHSMGIDRLGSLLDDLDREEERAHVSHADEQDKKDSEHWLEVMRGWASVWVPRFEEQDLALRELGRRVWCNLVTADCILNSHIDCFFATPSVGAKVHRMQTKPPWPGIGDEDVFLLQEPGERGDRLRARARQSTHGSSYESGLLASAQFTRQIAERAPGEPFDRPRLDRLLTLLPDGPMPNLNDDRRLFLEWCIHSVILRSGLPGLTTALKPGNSILLKTCTSSALGLVDVRRRMERSGLPWRRLILARTVLFQAVLVLVAILLENPADSTIARDLDLGRMRAEADEAMGHLRHDIDVTGKRNPVELPALEALEKLHGRAVAPTPRKDSLFEQLEIPGESVDYEEDVQWLLSLLWQGSGDH